MKAKSYIHALLAIAVACAATACDEDSWNREHLKGYEEIVDAPLTNVESVEYTLSAADYSTIAGLADNKALAGDDGADALAAVGKLRRFSADAPASEYVPAFLASTSFPYYTLTDGSAVKLTYNQAQNEPEIYVKAQSAAQFTITNDMYADDIWQSDDNIYAFGPSMNPARYIPTLLADYGEPDESPVTVVNYLVATQEPVFGNVDPGKPAEWAPSDVIATLASGDEGVNISGVVTAICGQGYIVADNSGSIFVYMGSSFDTSSVAVGQQLDMACTIGSYNKGLQVVGSSATVTVQGTQAVSYPAAKVYTGAELDQAITRTDNALAQYCTIAGAVTVTERNINVKPEGAETAQGSVYGITADLRALFTDGAQQSITGYFINVAGGCYCNMVVTAVDGTALPTAAVISYAPRATVTVPTVSQAAVYYYNGTDWEAAPAEYIALSDADYAAMGQSYANLPAAEPYLSIYLKNKFIYAAEGDFRYVVWKRYASGKTTTLCSAYQFNGTEWLPYTFVDAETSQFVRVGGKWIYDPNVTINLPAGRNQPLSTLYFQTCVDWVFENICKPLGDTSIKSGLFYIPSYGNNEYYSGTSAYQGNVDLRASAARAQYPAEYADMTDEAIVALEKSRFMNEVMPAALSILHSDATPLDGIDVNYIINFYIYDGTTKPHTAVFKVVAKGQFEPVSCTWDEEEN